MGKFDLLKKLFNPKVEAAIKSAASATETVLPKIDEVRAKQIAKAYADMKHDPTNPEVAKAYDALIQETAAQYDNLIQNKGLKVSRIEPGAASPYKTSQDLINDVEKNKNMSFFPTDQGFGSGTADISGNPLLRDSGRTLDGKPLANNDLFRIVHDYHGHTEPKMSFGPRGEEGAWQSHNKMFSPEAQKALASETRGQNSWVNYGPQGEANRMNPANTTYADQKTGLLPDWARDVSNPEGVPVVSYGKKGMNESSMFEDFEKSRAAAEDGEKYSTRIAGKIYDFAADPEKLIEKAAGNMDQAKALAKSAGYDAVSTSKDGKKTYETFKPVSMRPSYAVAGGLGLGAATLGGQEQAEASSFNGLKKLFNPKNVEAAEQILKQVTTADDAVKLVGPEREAYLKALDMVHGPKETRAANMGFGEKDWFHGTGADIEAFENAKLGSSTGAPSAGKGHFVATLPDTASGYAGHASAANQRRAYDQIAAKYAPELSGLAESEKSAEIAKALKELPSDEQARGDFLADILSDINYNKKAYAKFEDKESQSALRYARAIEKAEENYNLVRQASSDIPGNIAKHEKIAKDAAVKREAIFKKVVAEQEAVDKAGDIGATVYPLKIRQEKPLIKDFGGTAYREETYNDLLQRALNDGNDSALFKNTADGGDIEDIGVVFNPSQIRSKFAAFDPRFKDSAKIMAGTAGAVLGSSMLAPEQSQAGTVPNFNGIKKMFQVGEKVFPAANAAEALKVQQAMEKLGHIRPNHSLVALDEVAPVANQVASETGRGMLPKAAAGIGMAGGMPTEESVSPFQMLKEGLSKYKDNVVDPIAAKAKQVLTPDFNVGGQEYKTSSAVSDAAIDMAADPVNYIPGVGGAVAGAAQMVGELTPDKKFANTRKMFGK